MTGLRPQISLSLPQSGTEAAHASRYAEPIHVYCEAEADRWPAIVGKAVVIMVMSRAARKSAMQIDSMITAIRALPRLSD